METNKEETKIKEVIDMLRPFLVSDGGDVEFVKYENHIVYIKLSGACANCMLIDYTLKDGIEIQKLNIGYKEGKTNVNLFGSIEEVLGDDYKAYSKKYAIE